MSNNLADALKDRLVFTALKRLYNLKRLRELMAPIEIIERSSELLALSKKELGERFSVVLENFDEFYAITMEEARIEGAWERKCMTCVSWTGGYQNEEEDRWCAKYTFGSRSLPIACVNYDPVKDN